MTPDAASRGGRRFRTLMSGSGSGLMRFGCFAVLSAFRSLSCNWCALATASFEKPLVVKSTVMSSFRCRLSANSVNVPALSSCTAESLR